VGLVVDSLERLAIECCHHEAGDGDRLVSQGLPPVLDLEDFDEEGWGDRRSRPISDR
jgi:hypothetical protein